MSDLTAVGFSAPYTHYGSALNDRSPEVIQYHQTIAKLQAKIAAGEPIYVSFKDERRKGSIAKLTNITITRRQPSNHSWYGPKFITFDISDLEVAWDGRKNKIQPWYTDIEWLINYEGPTVWAWEVSPRTKKEIPKVYDRLGEEIQPGNFVSFIYQKYGAVELMYGTITRINENGTVWAKNMRMSSDDVSEEHRIRSNENIVIMEKNFMDKLMMFKLSLA